MGHVRLEEDQENHLEDKEKNFIEKFMIIMIRFKSIRFYPYKHQESQNYAEPLDEPYIEINYSQISEVGLTYFFYCLRCIIFNNR